jgi:hypothetical protein
MTTFPALVPSTRSFTPGEYPATAFAGYSGRSTTVRHSDVFIGAQLRLTFVAIPEADMLAIWNHYTGEKGGFQAFTLPTEIVSYGSVSDYVPSNYRWRYTGDGSVEDLPCGGHNVSITLETAPPVAASAAGIQLRLLMSLTAGAVSVQGPGSASGAALSLAMTLAAGAATGDGGISGIARTLTLSLAAGAATNGGAALGINQTLTLSLAAGAADAGTPSDPILALNPLLYFDFSDASTVTLSGSSITAIANKGSAGMNLAASGTVVQGTWGNGLKVADFGNQSHSNALRNTSSTVPTIAEIYIVLDADFGSTFPNFNGLVTAYDGGGWTLPGSVGTSGFYPEGWFNAAYVNNGSTNVYDSGALPAINSPSLLRVKRLNSTAITNGGNGFVIGMDRQNGGRGWYGKVAAVIAFSAVLSSTDRATVQNALASKWGLTLS